MVLIAIIILLIIIFLLIYKLIKIKKNKPISLELEKEIMNFMSNIDSVDVRDIEKIDVKKSNDFNDDTLDLNELFKTMSLTIVKDKSDYDFGLLRNTKK